jgi:hypothetical protein
MTESDDFGHRRSTAGRSHRCANNEHAATQVLHRGQKDASDPTIEVNVRTLDTGALPVQ